MKSIKELAKEVRGLYNPGGAHLLKLLDLIDGAEEQVRDFAHGDESRKGQLLFFPDPQPTLIEAAQVMLTCWLEPGCSDDCGRCSKMDNLKAALDRKGGCTCQPKD